ncbi:MAG: PIN domain-containing protein [Armatimonadota bacterium]|nr:PIN domain-containing protein [Armatimonadota bacterium]
MNGAVRAVMLDSGPLGLVSSPVRMAGAIACLAWLASLEKAGITVYVPELADYEVRRELLRAGKTASVARLDIMKSRAHYLPLTTPAMLMAAKLWAEARNTGRPTAGNSSLDADVILAAQALALGVLGLVIATSNPGHLSRYIPAQEWRQINP